MIPLAQVVTQYAEAFKAVDVAGPRTRRIGPCGAPRGLELALRHLKQAYPIDYQNAGPRAYPGSACAP